MQNENAIERKSSAENVSLSTQLPTGGSPVVVIVINRRKSITDYIRNLREFPSLMLGSTRQAHSTDEFHWMANDDCHKNSVLDSGIENGSSHLFCPSFQEGTIKGIICYFREFLSSERKPKLLKYSFFDSANENHIAVVLPGSCFWVSPAANGLNGPSALLIKSERAPPTPPPQHNKLVSFHRLIAIKSKLIPGKLNWIK